MSIEKHVEQATQNRIEAHRRAGQFLRDTEDLKWLYFDLELRKALDEYELQHFVLGRSDAPGSGLFEEAVRYIENPMYHCTALRDLFIVRLMEQLPALVANDPVPGRIDWKMRIALCFCFLVAVPLCWIYYSWWSAIVPLVFFWVLARRFERQYEGNANNKHSTRRYSKHFTQEAIRKLIERVRRGGFDEPTLIEQLQLIDVTKTAPNSVVPLCADGTRIRGPSPNPTIIPIQIPDVLYALLRLPRRNVESEISRTFFSLYKQKREELLQQWNRFVDRLVNYDWPPKFIANQRP